MDRKNKFIINKKVRIIMFFILSLIMLGICIYSLFSIILCDKKFQYFGTFVATLYLLYNFLKEMVHLIKGNSSNI